MENMQAIIDNCRRAKSEKGYSYQYIAEQSGIPKSTVERFFSSSGTSCRYDTVYPIVRFLIGFDDPTPATKDMAKELPLPPNEMIDWYKEIILKRETEAERMRTEFRETLAEIKAEHKKEISDLKAEQRDELLAGRKINTWLRAALSVTLLLIIVLVIIDLSVSGVGWIRG